MMRRIFSKNAEAAPSDVLPVEVSTCIAGASIYVRPSSEKVLVQLRGGNLFEYSADTAPTSMGNAFPGLSEAQIARAVRMLDSHVVAHARLQASLHGTPSVGARWSDWRPLSANE